MASSLVPLNVPEPSRAAAVIMRGILYSLGVLASRNFKTPLIMISAVRKAMWHAWNGKYK
jgi:hypothetical protein